MRVKYKKRLRRVLYICVRNLFMIEQTDISYEKTILIGLITQYQDEEKSREYLDELEFLAYTAGGEVLKRFTQKMDTPNPKTFIGTGKLEDVKNFVDEHEVGVAIFDDELSPAQQKNIERILQCKIIDRTNLILDIFAQRAQTSYARTQVELAQYEYYLPRLTGQWTHLERQAGGGGGRAGSTGGVGLRGPGETQLEVDKRAIRKRISHLKKELEKVRAHRMRYRAQRKRSRIPTVALVGYTNSGKSTLMNKIAKSEVYVANQLFATLDPTTRKVELPGGYQALFTDTVGFIQKLPTTLIEAFHATLEEIVESDLLLHLVDISHPNALNQFQSVQQTLNELGAHHIPVVTALNKADRLRDPESAKDVVRHYSKAVTISALKGDGIKDLLKVIQQELYETYAPVLVRLPYQQGALISLFHEAGQIERVEHGRGGVLMQGRIPGRLLAQFSGWQVSSTNHREPEEEEEI